MDPNKHFVQDTECDIFNRGSYGRGCELDKGDFPTKMWPSAPGQDLTPNIHTTYRPQYGVPPPLSPNPSIYGPKYGPPPSPPLQFFPVTPSPSPSPPYFPVRPITATPLPPTQHYPVTPNQYYPVTPSQNYPVKPIQHYPVTPIQHYPVTPTQNYPVTPTTFITPTRRTGTYVPSFPPTTFYQIPGGYTPVSVKPSNRDSTPGVFKDLFNPYGQNPTQVPTLYGPYGPAKKCKTTRNLISRYRF